MYQKGQKIVVHKERFPYSSFERDEFHLLTIVEEREVPVFNHLGQTSKTEKGFLAKDNNGNEYQNCWEQYHEDSASPYEVWYCPNDGINFWYDVCSAELWGSIEKFPKVLEQHSDFISFLPEMKSIYYSDRKNLFTDPVYKDTLDMMIRSHQQAEEKRKTWKGWN